MEKDTLLSSCSYTQNFQTSFCSTQWGLPAEPHRWWLLTLGWCFHANPPLLSDLSGQDRCFGPHTSLLRGGKAVVWSFGDWDARTECFGFEGWLVSSWSCFHIDFYPRCDTPSQKERGSSTWKPPFSWVFWAMSQFISDCWDRAWSFRNVAGKPYAVSWFWWGLTDWVVTVRSRSSSPEEHWLGPLINSCYNNC